MPECPSCLQEVVTVKGTFPWHTTSIYSGVPCLGVGAYPAPRTLEDA